ncbi:MAG: 3-dehydroquinate synthase [Treponema sp.]|jgi:3-dehydroquinate synthase|nr:3-dehydroquinate synthase [Treponema sp.]
MPSEFNFSFGSFRSRVFIRENLPEAREISGFSPSCLVVCDECTRPAAEKIAGKSAPLVLPPGERYKNWDSVKSILEKARERGLGRDGLFVAVGGGVICDLTAFSASVYMRGAKLALVPTTLLAMADAALGGKTGFDLGDIKNLIGTFYPAGEIFISLETLETLPEREWKSGMAEIIKAAVLDSGFGAKTLELFRDPGAVFTEKSPEKPLIEKLIAMAVKVKGSIVEADPRETGGERALLNLGHSFGHALETAAGLGRLSHGEAVAWGIARSCELGLALGITPPERAKTIGEILSAWGYMTSAPCPVPFDLALFKKALLSDKKKKSGKLRFVVPNANRAELVDRDTETENYLEKLMAVMT